MVWPEHLAALRLSVGDVLGAVAVVAEPVRLSLVTGSSDPAGVALRPPRPIFSSRAIDEAPALTLRRDAMIHASIARSRFQRVAERADGFGQIDHQQQRVGPVEDSDFPEFRGFENRTTALKAPRIKNVGCCSRLRPLSRRWRRSFDRRHRRLEGRPARSGRTRIVP
jgi:hypothetical protein